MPAATVNGNQFFKGRCLCNKIEHICSEYSTFSIIFSHLILQTFEEFLNFEVFLLHSKHYYLSFLMTIVIWRDQVGVVRISDNHNISCCPLSPIQSGKSFHLGEKRLFLKKNISYLYLIPLSLRFKMRLYRSSML